MKQYKKKQPLNRATVLFTVFYCLCASLLLALLYLLVPPVDVRYYAGGTLLLIVLAITGWAYLSIYLSIPQNMMRAFDDFKNRVVRKEITSADQFAEEFILFLTQFFDYAFFDIHHALMITAKGQLFCSTEEIRNTIPKEELDRQARNSEEVFYLGKIIAGNKKYFAYTIPLYFNKEYLGAFTVFSRQRLGPAKRRILRNLEEYFVDDLVFHLENRNNA